MTILILVIATLVFGPSIATSIKQYKSKQRVNRNISNFRQSVKSNDLASYDKKWDDYIN